MAGETERTVPWISAADGSNGILAGARPVDIGGARR
jgi:hypothetical protein